MVFLTITTYEIKLERKQNERVWETSQPDLEMDLKFNLNTRQWRKGV